MSDFPWHTSYPKIGHPLWTFPLQTFKSVIPSHFFDFLCQHGIGRCLNRCHNKSFVSHNVDWNKKIRNSIDSCQIQICQLIPSANRFQTSGLYRLIIFRKSLLFTILLKNFNMNYTQLYYCHVEFPFKLSKGWVATVFLVVRLYTAHTSQIHHCTQTCALLDFTMVEHRTHTHTSKEIQQKK